MASVSDSSSNGANGTEGTPKTPIEEAVEHAVDGLVYAPSGLLFEGASLLPQLIEKGKSQVTMARMIGQFAVTQGQSEAEKLANRFQDQAIELLGRFGGSTDPAPPVVASAPEIVDDDSPSAVDPVVAADRAAGAAIDASTLAIPDYDGLSASHVVNRLAGLSDAELEAVRLYESANRGRKTILSKVAQLQAG
jgi:hypothetical protein